MTEYRDLYLDLDIIPSITLARDIKNHYGWACLEEFLKKSGIGIEFIIIYLNTNKTSLSLPSLKLYYEGD